jgi:trehalose 2-sulfotransferase
VSVCAYMICSTPRSGSNLLCKGLAATGVLGRPREYFSHAAIHHYLGEWGGRHPLSTSHLPRCVPGFPYLDRVRSEAATTGNLALKVHWYQLEDAKLVERILDVFPGGADSKFVYLSRIDKVDQAISTMIANATRVYYIRPGREPRVSPWFEDGTRRESRYSFAEIASIAAKLVDHDMAWKEFFAVNRLSYEAVLYEELAWNYFKTMRRVMRFLGAAESIAVPVPQTIRQYSDINRAFRSRYINEARKS